MQLVTAQSAQGQYDAMIFFDCAAYALAPGRPELFSLHNDRRL
jgi:hypothetical protein